MKSLRTVAALALSLSAIANPAFAGAPVKDDKKVITEPCPPVPLDTVTYRSDYTFESDFRTKSEFPGVTRGSAYHNSFEVGRRIPIGALKWPNQECGEWFVRLGAAYERYDFGNHNGTLPLPDRLQSAAGVIALEYLVKGETAILIEARPGVYFEDRVDGENFNVPITLGSAVPLSKDVFFTFGAEIDTWRRYPVLPVVGLVWLVNDHLTLLGTLPEPKLLWHPNDSFQAWVGGEVIQSSFKTDDHVFFNRPNLSGAVVAYTEYRVGAGVSYTGLKPFRVDLAGGYAVERNFDFHRVGAVYQTDSGAPYVKVQLSAAF